MKKSVLESYRKISTWYDENRSRDLFEKSWLDKAIAYLKPNASILDIGCGMGEPIAKYFIDKGFKLTGIDGCPEFIEMANQKLPGGDFFLADMRTLSLNQTFDSIIAWNSFFHLSMNEQRSMFSKFSSHLRENGVFLFTSGPEAGEIWSDNGGENLYHASLSPNEYKILLKKHGFMLIEYKISDPECNGMTVWLSKKLPKNYIHFRDHN